MQTWTIKKNKNKKRNVYTKHLLQGMARLLNSYAKVPGNESKFQHTLRDGKRVGSAGFDKSHTQSSPSSAPEASRFGELMLKSRPRTYE